MLRLNVRWYYLYNSTDLVDIRRYVDVMDLTLQTERVQS